MLNLTLISFAGIEFNGTMNEYRMEKYDLSENLLVDFNGIDISM